MAHKAKGNRRNLKHDLVLDRAVTKQLVGNDDAIKDFMRKREELKKRREANGSLGFSTLVGERDKRDMGEGNV